MFEISPTRTSVVASIGLALSALAAAGCGVSVRHWTNSASSMVALAAYAPQADDLESRTIRKTFDAPADGRLNLLNVVGAITLKMTDGDEVIVEATIYARGRDDRHTEELLESIQWTTLEDWNDRDWHMLSFPVDDYDGFHYPPLGEGSRSSNSHNDVTFKLFGDWSEDVPTLFADLTIAYPKSIALRVRNMAGHVYGDRLAGDLAVGTGSGDVEIDRFTGELKASAGSGGVVLGEMRGNLVGSTGSGNITVERIAGDTVNCNTGSGDITIEAIESDSFDASVGSGNITIRDGEADAITMNSGSGRIEVDGVEFDELDIAVSSGDVLIVSSLEKAEHISVNTSSGEVRIEAAPDASFTVRSNFVSGSLHVGYVDAEVRRRGRKVVAARRGDGDTKIDINGVSGSCTITPGTTPAE